MIVLVVTVAVGILLAIFATQNTGSIDLNFGNYFLPNIPIYLVVLIPLLFGLLIAFLLHVLKLLSHDLTIDEQKKEIKSLKSDLNDITKQAHKLELENLKIKKDSGNFDEESIN